ncbi:MAG: 50S ribosomal protein L6 [Spirochaetaceae bacterium]|nr:50S ribosomal protein L6 [Spirochaetaceae bacterium]
MSRVGVVPVAVPAGVKVEVNGNRFDASGPKGALQLRTTGNISVAVGDGQVTVTRGDDAHRSKALHGLYRKLIANMVTGVSTGFSKVLVINGVGYRGEVQGNKLVLNLGYSNPIEYPIRDGVTIDAASATRITVSGADRQMVGQVAAEIRGFRPPEPYKGKGVRYENEYVRRKAGKAMAGAGTA